MEKQGELDFGEPAVKAASTKEGDAVRTYKKQTARPQAKKADTQYQIDYILAVLEQGGKYTWNTCPLELKQQLRKDAGQYLAEQRAEREKYMQDHFIESIADKEKRLKRQSRHL
jgi:hypothetical protein